MKKIFFFIILSFYAGIAGAAPYTPDSGSEVLETLPYSLSSTSSADIRKLQKELLGSPEELPRALTLAKALLKDASTTGDPRFYGRIEAVLSSWWKLKNPPVEVRKIRADVLQKQHHFDEALTDLEFLLAHNPADVQSRYMQASILRVIGKYIEAKESCQAMEGKTGALVVLSCHAGIDYLMGELKGARERLEKALQHPGRISPSLIGYSSGLLGEIAYAGGDYRRAAEALEVARKLSPEDPYILSLLADLYLQTGQADRVLELLKDESANDTLLLRLALAEEQSESTEKVYAVQFRERLNEARLRGLKVHLREESWFMLDIEKDPNEALQLALENWTSQKEPLDSLLVLRSALEANNPAAAGQTVEFLKRNNTEEVHLQKLIQKLEGER